MALSLIGAALGEYRVIAPLGVGGAGAVYLAEHPLLGRRVAIKVLHADLSRDPEAVERCFAEARAATALGDPRIAEVLGHGFTAERAYLVVEHIEGRTLGELLERGALPPAQALGIAEGIAGALAVAHERGLVHGDLKAENVFVFEPFRGVFDVKVVDFGIARLPARGRSTPAYLAPEQCAGLRADARTDVYALGALLFEMVAGRPPFAGAEDRVVVGHLLHPAPLVRRVRAAIPSSVEAVVARALEKRRGRRFQSMVEMRAALLDPQGYLDGIVDETILHVAPAALRLDAPAAEPQAPSAVPEARPPAAEVRPAPAVPEAIAAPEASAPAAPRPSRLRSRVLLAAGLVALFLFVGALRVAAPLVPRAESAVTTISSTVVFKIVPDGLPPRARVRVDGVDTGAPGRPIAIARGPAPVTVSVHACGFLPAVFRLVPDRDRLVDAVLVPRPPTPSIL